MRDLLFLLDRKRKYDLIWGAVHFTSVVRAWATQLVLHNYNVSNEKEPKIPSRSSAMSFTLSPSGENSSWTNILSTDTVILQFDVKSWNIKS